MEIERKGITAPGFVARFPGEGLPYPPNGLNSDPDWAKKKDEALAAIASASSEDALELVRVEFLGKKRGRLKELQSLLGQLARQTIRKASQSLRGRVKRLKNIGGAHSKHYIGEKKHPTSGATEPCLHCGRTPQVRASITLRRRNSAHRTGRHTAHKGGGRLGRGKALKCGGGGSA